MIYDIVDCVTHIQMEFGALRLPQNIDPHQNNAITTWNSDKLVTNSLVFSSFVSACISHNNIMIEFNTDFEAVVYRSLKGFLGPLWQHPPFIEEHHQPLHVRHIQR